MSGTHVVIRSGVLTAPPSDAEARVEMVWHLPGSAKAERLKISAREGEPLYLHLLSHAFAPVTVGPEAAFVFDGPSLCGPNGRPIIFRDPGSGYFADVYAEDATLELVITTDPEPPRP
jgi:hypothetical protein